MMEEIRAVEMHENMDKIWLILAPGFISLITMVKDMRSINMAVLGAIGIKFLPNAMICHLPKAQHISAVNEKRQVVEEEMSAAFFVAELFGGVMAEYSVWLEYSLFEEFIIKAHLLSKKAM